MTAKYSKPTDAVHKVTVVSNIIYCLWQSRCGYAGSKANFEVRTSFVGEGAAIEVTGKSEKGKTLGKISDTIRRNRYVGQMQMPDNLDWGDMIYIEARLPKQGLRLESNRIPVRPRIQLRSLSWDRKEVSRGDAVRITAEFKNLPDGTEATVDVLEFDQDGHHDKIASLSTELKKNKIELTWEFDYPDDTSEIPTEAERQKYGKKYQQPVYFFVVDIEGERFGLKQESGLLTFVDSPSLIVRDADGNLVDQREAELLLPDGTTRTEVTDHKGEIRLKGVVPGRVIVRLKDKH